MNGKVLADNQGCTNAFYRPSKQPEIAKQIIAEVCRHNIYRFRANKLNIAFNTNVRNRVMLWMLTMGLFTVYSRNSRGVLYQREFKYIGPALRRVDNAA